MVARSSNAEFCIGYGGTLPEGEVLHSVFAAATLQTTRLLLTFPDLMRLNIWQLARTAADFTSLLLMQKMSWLLPYNVDL
jgi:hypothetical protein